MNTKRGFFWFRATAIIPILILITIWLGVWAWHDRNYSYGDSLYRTVSLFDLGNDLYSGGANLDWRFAIGRWTGLASVFGAAIFALAAVLQERLALAAARWLRQDVVIIGGEGLPASAFEMVRRARRSVLWIGAPALGSMSFRSIALPWQGEDPMVTVATHAGNASHVLIAVQDDAQAMAFTRIAGDAAPKAYLTVLMKDVRLAEEAAATLNQARTRVLSIATLSARALHNSHPPFLIAQKAGHDRVHALVIGFGQTGQAMVRDLIVNCRTTFLDLPVVSIIDPNAEDLESAQRLRIPELDECGRFNFIKGFLRTEGVAPPADALVRQIVAAGPITSVYVCLNTDAAALKAAAIIQTLERRPEFGRPPIFVRLRSAGTVLGAQTGSEGLDGLTPFGDEDVILAASEFLSSEPDRSARAFSEAYRAALPDHVRNDPANRSARPWDELDETYRQANRDATAHVAAKMASAGIEESVWRGVLGLPQLPKGTLLYRSDDECEALARLEHERWNAQRRMDGWRWADLPAKDEKHRLHPSLAPYDDLSDEVKEYDRVYIRETQAASTLKR